MQELERQVELLRERDGQLQYTVKEQEVKIEDLKQKLKNTGDKVGPLHINQQIYICILGTYHLHGETGNSSWKIKWFAPFRLGSF